MDCCDPWSNYSWDSYSVSCALGSLPNSNKFYRPISRSSRKILGPLATAWAMVKTAAYIAPSHKKHVAIVMTVHWVFIAGGGFALSYFELDIGTGRLNLYAGGLPIVGGIVGSIIALLSELNDKEQIE